MDPDEQSLFPEKHDEHSRHLESLEIIPSFQRPKWLGAWYNCFGNCNGASWSACALSCFCPCVVSGIIVQRALKESLFIHILLFLIIFAGIHDLAGAIQSAYMHPYEVECGDRILGTGLGPSREFWTQSPTLPPACRPLVPWVLGRAGIDVAAVIIGAIWLSRKRSQIRKRFDIEGSWFKDFCLFCWCNICALAQEYRTLVHNNVEDGTWKGPGKGFQDGQEMKPPLEQAMV